MDEKGCATGPIGIASRIRRRVLPRLLGALGILAIVACGQGIVVNGATVTLSFSVATSLLGDAVLPPPYTAYVEDASGASTNRNTAPIDPDGEIAFQGIGAGREIEYGIEDLPPYCEGVFPLVRTTDDGIFEDTDLGGFGVTCWLGRLVVEVTTTGAPEDVDPDGYEVDLSGTETPVRQAIGVQATDTVVGLMEGTYSVSLLDVAPNCATDPGEEIVDLGGAGVPVVSFTVTCDPPAPSVVQGIVTDTAGVAVESAVLGAWLNAALVTLDTTDAAGAYAMEVPGGGAVQVTGAGKFDRTAFTILDSVDVANGDTATLDISIRIGKGLALDQVLGTINAAAAAPVTLPALDWRVWSRVGCELCSQRVVLGIEGEPQVGIHVLSPGGYPGTTGEWIADITAPASPGTYTIWIVRYSAASESDAFDFYTTRFPQQKLIETEFIAIGTLVVS